MRQNFLDYLVAVGLGADPYIDRIKSIHSFFEETCPESLLDIFVSEYLTEDGTRQFENLWFFSDKITMEAKNFLHADDFDLAPSMGLVIHLEIEKTNYDFAHADQASRMTVNVQLPHDIYLVLKASQENCDVLRDIVKQRIVPCLLAAK